MTNTQNQNPSSIDLSEELDTVEHAFKSLVHLGRLWASHGLRVAESAVKTTSETLRVTAETLRETQKRIDKQNARP